MQNATSALLRDTPHVDAPLAAVDVRADDVPARLFVEELDAAAAARVIGQWRDLAARCLEPNAFFEPDFALAAAALAGPRLRFIMVWTGAQGRCRRLLGVVPLVLPRAGVPLPIAHLWLHKNSTCATPWLDRGHAEPALRAALAFCRRTWPAIAGLCIGGTAVEGPFVRLLREMDVPVRLSGGFARAVLACTPGRADLAPASHRTLRKCRRRLERLGPVTFRAACDAVDVEAAVGAFLKLEASGWKNGRGALASRPHLADFARTATAGLAETGRCRIVSLDLGGTPIAMGIVLVSASYAFFWKIAYDEAHAAYSPGALLSLELTQALIRDPMVTSADSCADADHPMIGKLWPDRTEVGTCFVALRGRRTFGVAVAREVLWLEARQRLKAAVKRLRQAHRSA